MKKTLALVLALVMVIGMMAVPASAAYTDAADIQYKEAVDVMSAIGVIEGYNNEFNPKGELTRAAGAKLVAYLELGAKGAEALTAEKAPFADVPADHWAAGYIGWAAAKGYINGVGDNKFAPDAPLTALAYAKLMLCALGYDAAIEGLTGNGWEYNVLALALDKNIDLFDGNEDADFAKVATREEAALYSFNALNTTMVKYTSKGTVVEINGAVISTGASDATTTGMSLLREARYDDLKLTGSADAFGRPANVWKYDGDSVGTYAKDAEVTYTGIVKEKDVFTAIGADGIQGGAKYIVMDEIWVDGVKVAVSEKCSSDETQYQAKDSASVDQYEEAVIVAKGDAGNLQLRGSGAGTVVEIYETANDNHYKMVVVNEYLAKTGTVTKADAENGTKRSIAMTVYGVGSKSFETETLVKDQYVVVTIANGAVKTAKVAETATGKITSYADKTSTAAAKYVVDGETIALNQYVTFGDGDMKSFDNTYTFYLDSNGNVLRQVVKSAASSTDYFYVIKTQFEKKAGDLLDEKSVQAKAQVIFLDGTKKTIDLAIEVDDKNNDDTDEYYVEFPKANGTVSSDFEITTDRKVDVGNWFAYTVEDDEYTIEAIDADYAAVDADGVTLTKNVSNAIGSKYTTADTVITMIDSDYVVTTINGYTKDNETLTGKVLYTYAKDGKTVIAVYAVAQAAAEETVTYAYAVKSGVTSKYGTDWTFAINGEQKTVVVKASDVAEVTKGNVYKLTSAANDTYTVEVVGYTATEKDVVVAASGDQIIIDGASYTTMASSCKTYLVNEDDVAEFVGEEYTAVKDDVVSYILNSDNKIAVIYVTALAD